MRTSTPPTRKDAANDDYARLFERLEQSSLWLDAHYRIPLTRIHIGWDPIIGLVPIAGDIAGAAFSIRNIRWAYQLGADARLLRRMAFNATVDALLGAVPIAGVLFDIWYRAHLRNLRLLIDALDAHQRGGRREDKP
jgi:hypothetical protein